MDCRPVISSSACFTASAPLLLRKSNGLSVSCSKSTTKLTNNKPVVSNLSLDTNNSKNSNESETSVSRRSFAKSLVFSIPIVSHVLLNEVGAARADSITSQVTVYRDLPKGFTIFRPSGWNEFEGLQDNYDIKWQDVIQPLEFVTVLTSPVAKDKQLSDLGTPSSIGERLATARSAQLIAAEEKSIDGIPAYIVELKKDKQQVRQLTLLCISKMKLYSVNVSAPERRWSKREKLFRTVVNSFKPRL